MWWGWCPLSESQDWDCRGACLAGTAVAREDFPEETVPKLNLEYVRQVKDRGHSGRRGRARKSVECRRACIFDELQWLPVAGALVEVARWDVVSRNQDADRSQICTIFLVSAKMSLLPSQCLQ